MVPLPSLSMAAFQTQRGAQRSGCVWPGRERVLDGPGGCVEQGLAARATTKRTQSGSWTRRALTGVECGHRRDGHPVQRAAVPERLCSDNMSSYSAGGAAECACAVGWQAAAQPGSGRGKLGARGSSAEEPRTRVSAPMTFSASMSSRERLLPIGAASASPGASASAIGVDAVASSGSRCSGCSGCTAQAGTMVMFVHQPCRSRSRD